MAPCAIALDGGMDCIDQHLIVERLGQELGRAGLHRTHGHRNVAVPGDEDDRESDACFRKLLLKRESAHAGQPHVEHEAAGCVRPRRLREFLCRGEKAHVVAYRPEKSLERTAHGRIVVDDEHDGLVLAHDTVSCVTGKENRKTAPCGSFGAAHSRPPCASTIERLIDEADADAFLLRRVKRLEHLLGALRVEAGAGIPHVDQHAVSLVLP